MYRRTWLVAVCLGTLVIGCVGTGPDVTADSALAQMRARESTHHDACSAATSLSDERDETGEYVSDMDTLADDMIAACGTMMRAGTATQDDVDNVDDVRARMRTEIERHQTSVDAMDAVSSMHTECDTHHAAMLDLLDETSARLPPRTRMMDDPMM